MRLSREQVLQEMGLGPIWVERDPAWGKLETPAETPTAPVSAEPVSQAPECEPRPARAATAPWPEPAVDRSVPARPLATPPMPVPSGPVDSLDWPELAARVAHCHDCDLCQQRKQAVLGVGDPDADWLFIGEGPGSEEDLRGEPFVGQAGKLLDNMLLALNLKRGEQVYIANAVKCRPPGNRTPEVNEMAACKAYLERQIALIQPRIIVLLGKPAAHTLLGLDLQKTLGPLRGHRHDYQGIPVVVTYHPAYLLRNLPEKAKAWEDLLYARRILREEMAAANQESLF